MESYTCVAKYAKTVLTEKKSDFIARITPIKSEAEALTFINEIIKKEHGARHNCYAYINIEGNVVRFSDDGEPKGTAGMPILEVMTREGLRGTALVVTRYFGGILLGAGGLTRAYASAAKMAVDAACKKEFTLHITAEISLSYALYEKVQYKLSEANIIIEDAEFSENVKFTIVFREEQLEYIEKLINDLTSGTSKVVCKERSFR